MKRILVLCMMLLIALPLSACAGNTDADDKVSQKPAETTKATIYTEATTESVAATESTAESNIETTAPTEKPTKAVPATVRPAEEISDNEKPAENNSTDEDVSVDPPAEEDRKVFFVDTEYYTLSIPEYWENDCVYEIHRGENNTYSLVFYDKASHEEIGGGKLFTVRLLTETQEYTQYPDYDVLGSIRVDGAGLNAIVIYPTDVQFGPNSAEKYRKLQNEVDDVVATIKFKDGYDFSYQPL
ncbi:MAG: hypothetical protein UH080_03650 [Ruminococcus sp.]|nr:hypothetical protein [Ruminococcus sp.]